MTILCIFILVVPSVAISTMMPGLELNFCFACGFYIDVSESSNVLHASSTAKDAIVEYIK